MPEKENGLVGHWRFERASIQSRGGQPLRGDAATGGEVRDLPPKRFQAWTEGFAQAVDGIKGAWPKRALSRDDKQVLNMIRSAAIDDLTPTLKPLLPSWIQMTADKWREDL